MSDQQEVASNIYVYNEIIETQLYVMDKILEYNERAGDGQFYDKFREDLIQMAATTFRKIEEIQSLIAKDLKIKSNENRSNTK